MTIGITMLVDLVFPFLLLLVFAEEFIVVLSVVSLPNSFVNLLNLPLAQVGTNKRLIMFAGGMIFAHEVFESLLAPFCSAAQLMPTRACTILFILKKQLFDFSFFLWHCSAASVVLHITKRLRLVNRLVSFQTLQRVILREILLVFIVLRR